MRIFIALLSLLVVQGCGTGSRPAPDPSPSTAAGWSDDTLWMALQAQDRRDRAALLGFLHHARPDVRERAALAFASSPDSLALAGLIHALGDGVGSVRKAVAVAIGNAGDSAAVTALEHAADVERDTSVLHVMIEQVFKAKCDLKLIVDAEELFQVLGSGNHHVRLRAAQQLGRWPKEKMAALEARMLQAATTEHDPEVRMFLVGALKHYGSKPVQDFLMDLGAGDTLVSIRVSAIRALGARMDPTLQHWFLDRMNDGTQAVRLTAVEQLERIEEGLDAEAIWKVAQAQGDPFTQIPLYGLVLKHGGEGERLIARKLLEAQAALDNMPYAEAAILRAQANDAEHAPVILRKPMMAGASYVERTTAFEAILGWLKEDGRSMEVRGEVQFGEVVTNALSSGDAGLIATAAAELAEWEPAALKQVLVPGLEQKARTALRPIRDLEAIIALDQAVAKRDGKAAHGSTAPPFNHPIDRARLVRLKEGQRYVIHTNRGYITIALEPETAPGTCAAFDSLVEAGFYGGKYFHRVIPNFVAQGGCPRGDGYGSMDWTLRTEVGYGGFTKGAVGIASAGRDTESCQFFIMTAAAPHLDGRYTRFAHVVDGQDVADRLVVGDVITGVERLP